MELTESFIDLTILNDFGMHQEEWGGKGGGGGGVLTIVFYV